MKYLDLNVKTAFIVHGFDENNNEIIEDVHDDKFIRKLISIDRIQSVTKDYLLVTSSHGRVMYWQYDDSLENLKSKLETAGCIIS